MTSSVLTGRREAAGGHHKITQLAKMSIDVKFIELTADMFRILFSKHKDMMLLEACPERPSIFFRRRFLFLLR